MIQLVMAFLLAMRVVVLEFPKRVFGLPSEECIPRDA